MNGADRSPGAHRGCPGYEHLEHVYGSTVAAALCAALREVIARHRRQAQAVARDGPWDESDVALITYGDSIQSPSEPPLRTLHQFLAEHLQRAFGFVHILPFFPYSSDDGFAVSDYRAVNAELGDWDDIRALGQDFDLMFDLVINHVSRDHLWFTEFLNQSGPGCRFFIEADPRENQGLVVRPRNTPLLLDIHTPQGVRHVWATFSHDQVDLNYRQPEVLLEIADLVLFYVRQGARLIRLDAIAYLWKEIGTACIHLPKTHRIVKFLRALVEQVTPGCVLITETNVPHAENISYFGDGDEAHMVYQFSLPPLLLHAAHAGSTRHLVCWAKSLQAPPPGCTYFNFTASHDGVGLRPLEGLVPDDEVQVFLEAMRHCGGFISTKNNSDGSTSPYELNISYFDALRDTTVDDDKWHVERFLLTQTVPLSLQGIPGVYIHSLTATANDLRGVEQTGRTRSINRRKWDRGELESRLGRAESTTAKVFFEYRRRIELRRRQPAFHPQATQAVFELGDDLFVLRRSAPDGAQDLTAVYNFTPFAKVVPLEAIECDGEARLLDLLTQRAAPVIDGCLQLAPYQALWLVPQ